MVFVHRIAAFHASFFGVDPSLRFAMASTWLRLCLKLYFGLLAAIIDRSYCFFCW
jgi:hypothetical protein